MAQDKDVMGLQGRRSSQEGRELRASLRAALAHLATTEDLDALAKRLDILEQRIAELEQKASD